MENSLTLPEKLVILLNKRIEIRKKKNIAAVAQKYEDAAKLRTEERELMENN